MPGIDFSKRYSDYARFLPAVSEMYTRFVVNPNPKRISPIPQSDLDFFNPASNLWYLPCALYSAGQAAKSEGAAKRKDMITGRTNTSTTILGDSGGFQIQQGSIKFKGDTTRERMMRWLEKNCDWSMILDFPTGGINMGTIDAHHDRLMADGDTYEMKWFDREIDPVTGRDAWYETDKTGEFVLNKKGKKIASKTEYQGKRVELKEYFGARNLDQFIRELGYNPEDTQERGFATCMFQTLVNNVYFENHRVPAGSEGSTKFLNVVQGRTIEESNDWYERVKHFQFEGWSLAGPHKEKFDMTLTRLLSMRADGLLANKDWLHILGVGKLANGCAYTTMQRMIRKHDNPNFTISYDVSSPFTTAAFGNLFLGYTLDKDGWTIQSDKLDGRNYLPNYPIVKERFERRFPKKSKLPEYRGDELFLDELKVLWDNIMKEDGSKVVEGIFKGDAARRVDNSRFIETHIGKSLRMRDICVNKQRHLTSTWDVVTYALLMNHNVQVHLEGVFESQDLYDKGDVNRVPHDMLVLKGLIEKILDPATPNPLELIEHHKKELNCLAGDKANSGVVITAAMVQDDMKVHKTKSINLKEHLKEISKSTELNKVADEELFAPTV